MAETREMLQCRMYENKFPEVDDLVMVNVRQIAEMGAYVQLLEYNNIEGMILLSELSRRRIRSVQKLIRVGRHEVVVVLRVDKEKGYIDLSKRRVSPEEINKCEERYNKSKAVHSIMRHVAEKTLMSLERLYSDFCWPLYAKYGHAIDAFKIAINDPAQVLNEYNIPSTVLDELLSNIKRRLTPQILKIRADIEVTCYAYEGIEAVKKALKAGEQCRSENVDIKVKLVAPPLYVMVTHCMDKQLGIETLDRAILAIEETIKKSKGKLAIKMKPRAVTDNEDHELAALMERVQRENEQVNGDDDDEDEDEDDGHQADANGVVVN